MALDLLAEARGAARAFRKDAGRHAERLHEFRVAVRRLRGWLRLWRGVLDGAPSRRDERRLRRLWRATGAARDLDVQRDWLAGHRTRTRGAARKGVDALMARLDAGSADARRRALQAADALTDHHDALARRLATYRVDVRARATADVPYGAALAAVIDEAGDTLAARLASIASPTDDDAIHAARIAARRLRYLLDPLDGSLRGVPRLTEELRALQDLAGSLHDACVLTTRLARDQRRHPGDTAQHLRQRLAEQERRAFAALERGWLGAAAVPFFGRLRRIAIRCRP